MKSAMPLVLLWLAAHAALLAIFLAVKFLFTKTVVIAMLVMGALAFLFVKFRASPRKLPHSPVL
jgi:heme/copper-type cytochrome/quinol oxidase subunit 2